MSSLFSGAKDILIGDERKIAKPISNFNGLSFNAPGLGINTFKGGFDLTRSPANQAALQGLSGSFSKLSTELGALKPLVSPAFGNLTKVGSQAIEDSRRKTVGNLRENLSRRKALGSSFAADDISRTNAEFAKTDAQFRTETKLKEIEATANIATKQYEAAANSSRAILEQGNFESTIAAELSRQYNSSLAELAKFEAALLRDEADGQAALLAALGSGALGGAFDGVGGALGDFIGGGIDKLGDFLGIGAAGAASASVAGGTAGTAAGAAAGAAGSVALEGGSAAGLGIGGFLAGPGEIGTLSSAVSPGATGFGAFTAAPGGPGSFGAPAGFAAAGEPFSGITIPIDASGGVAPPAGIFSGASGAALAGGGIAAAMALLNGEGLRQAIAQGGGAAGGAALGFSVGGPVGAVVGGIAGSLIGGSLGKKLGLSANGGGDDKPDYDLQAWSGGKLGSGITSQEGPWGIVGFGRQKHLTNVDRYQSGLDAVIDTDKIIASMLTPEENKRMLQTEGGVIGSGKNEGGFNPGRMMTTIFADRANRLKTAIGDQRFAELGLGEIYKALGSGDQEQINKAFGV